MPQMAPISWLILFVFFSLSFITFLIMNYFNFFNVKLNSSANKNLTLENNKTTLLNWKW